jgi:hypothetical protein
MRNKIIFLVVLILLGAFLFSVSADAEDVNYKVVGKDIEISKSFRKGIGVASISESKVMIKNVRNIPEELDTYLDEYQGLEPEKFKITTDFIAVDNLEFDEAVVRLNKKGKVDVILKCNEFDIEFNCLIWEETDIEFEDLGGLIEFRVKEFSGYAGGEIKAIDAEHLDENYEFISNIFNEVEHRDGVWSEPIWQDEYVRVTYETELTDGKFIDVFARSNNEAYFEVYEAGTDNLVGRSGTITREDVHYIKVEGLSEPNAIFDFKIVKMMPDPNDNSTDIDFNSESYIEFDYIHDDAINYTHADGLIVYAESTINTPRYRTWNESLDFSSELTDMTDTGGDTKWTVIKGAPTRDEMLVGTINDLQQLNIERFNSSDSWDNFNLVSSGIWNSGFRGFDITYEEVSGDAVIVYENDAADTNSVFAYRIWNGSNLSAEQTFTTTSATNRISWISLSQKKGTDNFMALIHNDAGDLYAVPWNGTGFVSSLGLEVSSATTSSTEQHFAFAWEENSGQGIIGYGEGNNFVYRTYDPVGGFGSTENTIGIGNGLDGLRMCSEPTSDYIGIIWEDAGNDLQVRMWNGTGIANGEPSEDATVEPNGGATTNIDCIWLNSTVAIFGFIDNTALSVDYFNFTKPNTWGTTDLTSTANSGDFATNDIGDMRFYKHPTTAEFMVIAQDISEDLSAIRFNGTSFVTISASPLETSTESNGGSEGGASFAYFEFDPSPTIGDINPNSTFPEFALSSIFDLNVTVTDNLNVSTVIANITLPNGSVNQYTLSGPTSDLFNITYSTTNMGGIYTIKIIANDSNNNIANSNTSFNISDTIAPNVSAIIPNNESIFNTTDVIEIAANVTDNGAISTVLSNITLPNGTSTLLTLTIVSAGPKYNSSYTIPGIIGNFNLTILANDTTNTLNNSESSNFTTKDVLPPTSLGPLPSQDSSYNISDSIEISINVTDNVEVSAVSTNITLPNGTVNTITLSIVDSGPQYNNSYTVPKILGLFNLTYIANDTSGNINSSTTSNFTSTDTLSPILTNPVPGAGSTFKSSNITEIAVNVTDNLLVQKVIANITLPNGTVTQLNLINSTALLNGKYNQSYTIPSLEGRYNVSYFSNDSQGNINSTVVTHFFNTDDTTAPSVNSLIPTGGTDYNASVAIELAANVTDAVSVGTVFANITLPNGTLNQATFTIVNAGPKYNTSYTTPVLVGRFNITFIANDTEGNINSSETSFFTVTDTDSLNITIRGCEPSIGNLSQSISCNASISDDFAVDTVFANITLPNGSIMTQTISNFSENYTFTFTNTDLVGRYNISWIVNDSSNNLKFQNDSFNITDLVLPTISLDKPIEQFNTSSQSVTFNFTAVEDYDSSFTCAINIDGSTNQTNTSTQNNTNTLFTITGFKEGAHTWNITCNDSSLNTNSSESRNFTTDLSPPRFISLTTDPSSAAKLDPGVNVTIIANLSDNYTELNLVLLQWKLSADGNYTNLTLSLNNTDGTYTGEFNASNSSIYNLRIWANDSVSNQDTSTQFNITVVNETSWSRTPSTITISATPYQNLTIGNITINNTGDISIDFNISSTNTSTLFNSSTNFTLSGGQVNIISINDTAPVQGTKTITIITNATTVDADPESATTTINIVVAPGQPVLSTSFIAPASDNSTVTIGDSGVTFVGKIENLGEGNATNVTFSYTIPDNWTLSLGSLSTTYDEFPTGSSENLVIEVDISGNASLGAQTITLNATGLNESGTNLTSLNLTFGSIITVTVKNSTTITSGNETSSTTEEASSTPGGSSGGGGGGSAAISLSPDEKVYSKTIEVIRGRGETKFLIEITPPKYAESLKNLKLKLDGYPSQYIKISPTQIRKINNGETLAFTVTINAPAYKKTEIHELRAIITGTIVKSFGEASYKETQNILLYIQEISKNEAEESILLSKEAISQMISKKYHTIRVQKLLSDALISLEERRYKESNDLAIEIIKTKEKAFFVDNLIRRIIEAERNPKKSNLLTGNAIRSFESPDNEKTLKQLLTGSVVFSNNAVKEGLSLAIIAFERGDFDLAEERAKQAQTQLILERKGNLGLFFYLYWHIIIIGTITTIIMGALSFRRYQQISIIRNIGSGNIQEKNVINLMTQNQKDYFAGKISASDYHGLTKQHERKISKIRSERVKLRNKRLKLLKPENIIENLIFETEEVKNNIKKIQQDYYIAKNIPQSEYDIQFNSLHERLSEIEEEKTTLHLLNHKPTKHKKKIKLRLEAPHVLTKLKEITRKTRLKIRNKSKEKGIMMIDHNVINNIKEQIKGKNVKGKWIHIKDNSDKTEKNDNVKK